jgi:hypothetical protein
VPGSLGSTFVVTNDVPVNGLVDPGFVVTSTANCGDGAVVLAGGGNLVHLTMPDSQANRVAIRGSFPSSDTAWTVRAVVLARTGNFVLSAYAVCGSAGAPA